MNEELRRMSQEKIIVCLRHDQTMYLVLLMEPSKIME
jgi:hypothetical protein